MERRYSGEVSLSYVTYTSLKQEAVMAIKFSLAFFPNEATDMAEALCDLLNDEVVGQFSVNHHTGEVIYSFPLMARSMDGPEGFQIVFDFALSHAVTYGKTINEIRWGAKTIADAFPVKAGSEDTNGPHRADEITQWLDSQMAEDD